MKATIRIKVTQMHTKLYMSKNRKEYSKWFPGDKNNVADALSWDWDRSYYELTNFLSSFFPTHMQKNFSSSE